MIALSALMITLVSCTSAAGPNGFRSPTPPRTSSTLRSGSTSASRPGPTQRTQATPNPRSSGDARTVSARVAAIYQSLTASQRVGQLFMAGCPSTSTCEGLRKQVSSGEIGSLILSGRSFAGSAAIRATTSRIQGWVAGTAVPGLFLAVDQEGGDVQALRGPGFARIPTALDQGTMSTAALSTLSRRWGGQLRRAGINLDLAPVLDTVPNASAAAHNPPIGGYRREFGYSPSTVTRAGGAVVAGLLRAGVDTTIKHFPGLGRVSANTDRTAGVTDYVTTASDPYLQPYRDAIQHGTPFVMMATAVYAKIDPTAPAAFSRRVVTGLLRGRLGFSGVVISDDVGASAQVRAWSPGERATLFLDAGGDMVLTVDASLVPIMRAAVMSRIASNATFAARVAQSVKRILTAKVRAGLTA